MPPRHSSRIATHLGALALALAASQAGATTYSVPLQFTLSLTAPVCSLTVGSVTADATTPTPATGVTVNLTPTPLSVVSTPISLLASIPGTSTYTTSAPGLYTAGEAGSPNARKLDNMPAASATCTAGTPMTARIIRGAPNNVASNAYMAGRPGSGQSGTLPIGMAMGIAGFGSVVAPSTRSSTTLVTEDAAISTVATGTAQSLQLTAMFATNISTALSASYAGDWFYPFTVNLDF